MHIKFLGMDMIHATGFFRKNIDSEWIFLDRFFSTKEELWKYMIE